MKPIKAIGAGTIQQLSCIGELASQFWSGMGASPRILPLFGKRGRWRAALLQMYAIGAETLPMVATSQPAEDSSWRFRAPPN